MEEIIENIYQQRRGSLDREELGHASLRSLGEALQAQRTRYLDLMQRNLKHQSMMKSMTTLPVEVCHLRGLDAATFLQLLNQRAD